MPREVLIASLVAVAISPGLAQSTDRPSFEVASIKVYPPGAPFPRDGTLGIKVSPDGVSWRYARLQNCIGWAYDIPGRITGPEWIADRYDIAAKASGPASKAELRLMVQTLLEDRFKLKVHREMQDIPVVVLTVAKSGSRNLQPAPPAGSFKYEPSNGELVFEGSMSNFAMILGNSPPYGVREQVVDQTGLAGWFNFALDVKDFDVNDPSFGGKYEEMQPAAFAFLSSALEKKYGLKLEHRKVSMESLVVDSGNKTPTEN
jgi:uncharacterized protein (TIGR03435 family)